MNTTELVAIAIVVILLLAVGYRYYTMSKPFTLLEQNGMYLSTNGTTMSLSATPSTFTQSLMGDVLYNGAVLPVGKLKLFNAGAGAPGTGAAYMLVDSSSPPNYLSANSSSMAIVLAPAKTKASPALLFAKSPVTAAAKS